MGFLKKAFKAVAVGSGSPIGTVLAAGSAKRVAEGESTVGGEANQYNPLSKDKPKEPADQTQILGNQGLLGAIQKGEAVGKQKADEILGGQYAERTKELEDLKSRGLSAAEYAPIQKRFQSSSRALRGAQGGAGVKGATRSMALQSQQQQMQVESAQAHAQILDEAQQRLAAHKAKGEALRFQAPLAYGTLYGQQEAEKIKAQIAGQPLPEQKKGLFTDVFSAFV